MPKIRVTEVAKLPTGTARFQETAPALKAAFLSKVAEGKVAIIPNWNTTVTENGYTTTITECLWNNKDDYEQFKNWAISNYHLLKSEYYYSIFKDHNGKTSVITTEQEE